MDRNLYFQRGIQIITKINEVTPQAYLIGGVVRDYLLQANFNDIDIATSATPEQILELFPHASKEFLEYGCIVLKEDDMVFEITTFREEEYNNKSRKPSEIHFSKKLLDDVKRRDFTINALAMPKSKVLVDLVGGEKDLQAKLVRCIGQPKKRFKEDPLRILRGLNLVAKLNFNVEKKTLKGMTSCKKELLEISNYKFTVELANILNNPYGLKAFKVINRNGIFSKNPTLAKWAKLVQKKYEKLTTLEKFALLYRLDNSLFENTSFTKETLGLIKEIELLSLYLEHNQANLYDLYKNDFDLLVTADLINQLAVKKYRSQMKLLEKLSESLDITSKADIVINAETIIEVAGCTGEFVGPIFKHIEKDVVLKKLPNEREVLVKRIEELLAIYKETRKLNFDEVNDEIKDEVKNEEPVIEVSEEKQETVTSTPEETLINPVVIEYVESNIDVTTSQEEDLDQLIKEYQKELRILIDKKLIELVDENTSFEELERLQNNLQVTCRLLTIKANPKFKILMERGLI